MPTVSPMLAYEDAAAALEWLAKAFGFRERTRIEMPDGSIGHAEMEVGDGSLMLAEPTPEYQSPKPQDSPAGRLYRAADLEGQRWMFMQRPRA